MNKVLLFVFLLLHISCDRQQKRIIDYHSNGEIKLIEIVEGLSDARCTKEFYDNKILKKVECGINENGSDVTSVITYYPSGTQKYKGSFVDSLKQEEHVSYYSNGEKYEVKNFLNDTLNGFQYNYRKNGSLRAINYFNKGELIYKRIEDNDSLEFESIKPIIKPAIDIINKKLIAVKLHIPEQLIEDKATYRIFYDVKELTKEGGAAPYPERELSMTGEPVDVELDMDIGGYLWVYGFVTKKTKDTTIRYDTFELELSLE